MAEDLSSSLFGGAGSNPARYTILGYSFFAETTSIFKNVYSNYLLLLRGIGSSKNPLVTYGRVQAFCLVPMAEWSKAGGSSSPLFGGAGSNPARYNSLIP